MGADFKISGGVKMFFTGSPAEIFFQRRVFCLIQFHYGIF
jgi:hypothetical protein